MSDAGLSNVALKAGELTVRGNVSRMDQDHSTGRTVSFAYQVLP